MSETNPIYEITRQLSSPNIMQNELKEIRELALQHIRDKYLSPINAAVASGRDYYKGHPSKEITLLEAFKPFVKDSSSIDALVDTLNILRIFSNLTAGTEVAAASSADPAVHPDGIYEIDEGCMAAGAQSRGADMNLDLPTLFLLLFVAYSLK